VIDNLVSVIIPVHNRSGTLPAAVASALEQSYRPVEIIIVDDGSTDRTSQVAEGLAHNNPDIVRVLRQENLGPGRARQTGLEAARGEFIQFLDSDDLLLPDKFSEQVAGLRADPEAGIAYGLTLAEDVTSGERRVTHGTDKPHRELFPAVLSGRLWATVSPLYRRTVCDAIGPWSDARILEDWDYDGRAGLLGVKLHYCGNAVAVKRQGFSVHAGLAWQFDERAMRDRVAAYMAAYGYAKQAGVSPEAPEMEAFARSLFWMAREAGRYGLGPESRHLFELSREASGEPRRQGLDYRLYKAAATLLGWSATGRLSGWLDKARG
jgi:glycosyltransferase involved in cell wall biosynthesis